jgi:hypothetical protein
MKKILTLIMATFLMTSVNGFASSHGQQVNMHEGMHKKHDKSKKMAMKHANPLPNLMKVVSKYGDQLDLSEQQNAALADWRKKNNKKTHALVKQVIASEKQLHTAALSNASQSELQDLMDKVLGVRLQIAKTKISCRENMRKILSNDQWNKVVTLYRQNIIARK